MIRVGFEELDGIAIEKMVVVEADDYERGQCVGYRCQYCYEADESLTQIFHDRDCPYAGEHGRTHYDTLNTEMDARPTPELQANNPVWLVVSDETDRADDVYNGEPVAFRCECGNLDDDLLETVHDDGCDLADEHCDLGRTNVEDLAQVHLTPDDQRV
jgi:hypothetical protein